MWVDIFVFVCFLVWFIFLVVGSTIHPVECENDLDCLNDPCVDGWCNCSESIYWRCSDEPVIMPMNWAEIVSIVVGAVGILVLAIDRANCIDRCNIWRKEPRRNRSLCPKNMNLQDVFALVSLAASLVFLILTIAFSTTNGCENDGGKCFGFSMAFIILLVVSGSIFVCFPLPKKRWAKIAIFFFIPSIVFFFLLGFFSIRDGCVNDGGKCAGFFIAFVCSVLLMGASLVLLEIKKK